jgi:hypothetical protein
MSKKKMYFGTRERMSWINCPSIDAGISSVGWQSVSQYINGGAGVRRSSTGHKEFEFVWPMASAKEAGLIKNYANGTYGHDLLYFLDPFAIKTNVLPTFWAVPRLAQDDAPPFVVSRRPTLVDTGSNTMGYPTKSAAYEFKESDVFDSVYIPVPPGYTFHFGAHGLTTGTATITLQPHYDGNSVVEDPMGSHLYSVPSDLIESEPNLYTIGSLFEETSPGSGLYLQTEAGAQPVQMLSTTSSLRTNVAIPLVSGVTVSFSGVGNLAVSGMIAQVRPDGETVPEGEFIGGEGHSGCRFAEFPTVMGYSSPQALDKQNVSARLIETGAWE